MEVVKEGASAAVAMEVTAGLATAAEVCEVVMMAAARMAVTRKFGRAGRSVDEQAA